MIHKGLADGGGYYLLRARSSLQNNDDKETTTNDQIVVSTFVKAVSIMLMYRVILVLIINVSCDFSINIIHP